MPQMIRRYPLTMPLALIALATGCALPPPVDNQNGNPPANTNFNFNRNTNANTNANANDNQPANVNVNDNANANANDNTPANTNDNTAGELVELDTITFDGDVPAGLDPTSTEVGGGRVDFSNGVNAAVGFPSLTSSGLLSWLPKPGTAVIAFTDLDVRRVELYFADFGSPGATLSARTASGSTIATISTVTTGVFGDPRGRMVIDGGGQSIARLVVEMPTGVTVAVDDLQLTVFE